MKIKIIDALNGIYLRGSKSENDSWKKANSEIIWKICEDVLNRPYKTSSGKKCECNGTWLRVHQDDWDLDPVTSAKLTENAKSVADADPKRYDYLRVSKTLLVYTVCIWQFEKTRLLFCLNNQAANSRVEWYLPYRCQYWEHIRRHHICVGRSAIFWVVSERVWTSRIVTRVQVNVHIGIGSGKPVVRCVHVNLIIQGFW